MIEIDEGVIRLSYVVCRLDTDQVKLWEIDCNSKYPEFMQGSSIEGEKTKHLVYLVATERTLRTKEGTDKPTMITLDLDDSWTVLVDAARYTVRIVAVQRPEGEVVWEKPDDV